MRVTDALKQASQASAKVAFAASVVVVCSPLLAEQAPAGDAGAEELLSDQPAITAPRPGSAPQAAIHRSFDEVLRANVADGKVNYPGIAQDPRFADYLEQLKVEPAFGSREQELAYWINAYNALAIKGILDGKSPASFLGRIVYFKTTDYPVGGKKIDLYDLEREILIPLGEPRIHFAIVCASASCPKLRSEAYTADRLEQQLEVNARAFINDPTRNHLDREHKIAYLSKIFDWFDRDFEQHSGSVQRYVARYVDDPELAKALENERYRIKHLKYDWNLNGTPPKAQASVQ